ncbi:MAG: NAD(P)H-binding protein [Chloroflexota bacterium]
MGEESLHGPRPLAAASNGTGPESEVLLTGASGFVGRRLAPALLAAGWRVRSLSRDAAQAARRWPEQNWRQADLSQADDLARALDGCRVAYYLVHSLGEGSGGLLRRERELAETFARAAERAGIERIVYLGGVAPQGAPSEHLRSRLEAGAALRAGQVPALELRAAMIVGYGSASWLIVRDLAARLPLMILPSWLRTRSQPIAIDDVVAALAAGAGLPLTASASYDLPGAEVLTGRQILLRTARALGHRRLALVEVPVLSPGLSSHWVRLITRADWSVARELVLGLTHDLLARSSEYWALIERPRLLTFDEGARRSIQEERREGHMAWSGRALESVVGRLTGGQRG